jgi:hypothetical protein
MVRPVLLVLALFSVAVGQAKADPVLYSSGPINGIGNGYNISGNGGYAVSDSFTLANASNLTGAQLGLYTWGTPGPTPESVQWSIGTTPFGSDKASGTNSLTSVFQNSNYNASGYFSIFSSTFPLNQQLGSGNYWLTLQNATSSDGNGVAWDQNYGASTTFSTFSASPDGGETFQIFGTVTTATPEPASITLLGIGIAGFAGYGWRSRAKNRSKNAVA